MFVPSRIRGRYGEAVTVTQAVNAGRALADTEDRVAVGHGPSEPSKLLADAVATGARERGAAVTRLGRAGGPTVAHAVRQGDATTGVAVVGPWPSADEVECRLYRGDGRRYSWERQSRLVGRVITRETREADRREVASERRRHDATERHRAWLRGAADPLGELSVVVETTTPAGTAVADVIEELGGTVERLAAAESSGPAGPSEPPATRATAPRFADRVAATADVGVAHDADGRRFVAVTEDGDLVPGDALVALFARDAAETHAGGRVAVPTDASPRIDELVTAAGGVVDRTGTPDAPSSRPQARSVVYQGTPSGMHAWADAVPFPDGAYAAVRLAGLLDRGEPLSTRLEDLRLSPVRREELAVENPAATVAAAADRLDRRYDDVVTDDGVVVDCDDGWFALRPSRTGSRVRVSAGAPARDRRDVLFARARDVLDADAAEDRRSAPA